MTAFHAQKLSVLGVFNSRKPSASRYTISDIHSVCQWIPGCLRLSSPGCKTSRFSGGQTVLRRRNCQESIPFWTWNAPPPLSPCGLSNRANGNGIPCRYGLWGVLFSQAEILRHPAYHSPWMHPALCWSSSTAASRQSSPQSGKDRPSLFIVFGTEGDISPW